MRRKQRVIFYNFPLNSRLATLGSRQKKRLKKRLLTKKEAPLKNKLQDEKTELEPITDKKDLFDPDELDIDLDNDFPKINDNLNELVSDEEMEDLPEDDDEDKHEEESQPEEGADESESEADGLTTNIGDSGKSSGPTYDMSLLTQRIKDSLLMLGDFKKRAPAGLTRTACVESLLNDLCQRYSYNRFMINMLYDLFPKEVRCTYFNYTILDP